MLTAASAALRFVLKQYFNELTLKNFSTFLHKTKLSKIQGGSSGQEVVQEGLKVQIQKSVFLPPPPLDRLLRFQGFLQLSGQEKKAH